MNWDALGASSELVAAIAVVLTLLYLALQIKQANRLSRFQTSRDIFAQVDDNNRLVVENQILRNLAFKRYESLTAEETKQLSVYVGRQCNALASLQTAYDHGLVDDALFVAGKNSLKVFMKDWPNINPILVNWTESYPSLAKREIFEELHITTNNPE